MRKVLLGLCCLWSVAMTPAEAQIPEGTVIKGALQIGSRSFALPPGDWTVVAVSEGPVTMDGVDKRGTFSRVHVVQLDPGNHFVAAILYQTTTSSIGGVDSWTAEPCKRTDTLFRDTLDGNFKFPACLLVNHVTNFSNSQSWRSASDAKVYAWLSNRKVELPYAVVSSQYTKYGPGDFVSALVWLNPEVAGLDPTPRSSWRDSPWQRDLLGKDPQRVAYIDKVKAWDSVFVASVRESFMGSRTASVALPPLPGTK
jgi:hypothetical protein